MCNDMIYVYCISDSPPVTGDDISSRGVKSVCIDDFYLIVKEVSGNDFSEKNLTTHLSDIQWLEANAREHILVINAIMEHNTVIPFKFGTIFHSDENMKRFIADYSRSLTENFNYIKEKEEWSVKIYCDRRKLSEHIDELSEDAASLEKQIMASAPGKAFLLKRKKTDLVELEIDRLCKLYGQQYYDGFKNLSESTSLNNLLPKEFTGRDDTMILNAAFLVHKSKFNDFKNSPGTVMKPDEISSFFIETSGPWPPFSFIRITEK